MSQALFSIIFIKFSEGISRHNPLYILTHRMTGPSTSLQGV